RAVTSVALGFLRIDAACARRMDEGEVLLDRKRDPVSPAIAARAIAPPVARQAALAIAVGLALDFDDLFARASRKAARAIGRIGALGHLSMRPRERRVVLDGPDVWRGARARRGDHVSVDVVDANVITKVPRDGADLQARNHALVARAIATHFQGCP